MSTRTLTTTIRLPLAVWRLLRQLAQDRAEAEGGRPSASSVVADLVQAEGERRGAATRA